MFYPSYSDTSSTNSENKPLSANLYLKREKGWSVPIICWFNKKFEFKSKMLTRSIQVYSFVPQFDACLH